MTNIWNCEKHEGSELMYVFLIVENRKCCLRLVSPGPGRVLCPDLVSEGGGDGGVTLPGDGKCEEHRGGDGHVTHNIADSEQQPGHVIRVNI